MPISVRSHLIAGTAALAVAGVTAVAPLPAAAGLASPSIAPVTLTALATPIQELLATLNVGQTYLLGAFYNGADAPTWGAGAANWIDAGIGDYLNFQLTQQAALGKYIAVGILPQLVNQAQPILRQLESNILDYANVLLSGLIDAGIALNAGVWGFPPAAIEAAQLALGGQFGPALQVIGNAIADPIIAAGTALFGAGAYVLDRVVTRIAAVFSAIPQILSTYVGWSVGGTALLAEKTANIASEWIDDLSQGEFAAAWDTAVKGLFGPTGLPGLSLNLSIGAGVQTGPITGESDIPDNFVPSARTAVQATAWILRGALSTEPTPQPTAARAAAAEQTAVTVPDAADIRDAAADETGSAAQTSPVATESSSATADVATATDAEPSAKTPRGKRVADPGGQLTLNERI